MLKILVTGANGQMGNEFRRLAAKMHDLEFIFTDVGELDITNEDELNHFLDQFPVRFIINCAAYTNVDKAEDEPAMAYRLNAEAVDILGRASVRKNFRLIHYSTDFVFDGNQRHPYGETDIPGPLSVYGKTKLAGEAFLHKLNTGIIIRTSWLYSSYGHNFVKTILRLANEKNELRIVDDQTGSPTWASDMAEVTLRMIRMNDIHKDHGSSVVFHYSNEGSCSWFEFAGEITRLAGLNVRIVPITTPEYPMKAVRPCYSVLNKSMIRESLGIEIPHWKESLKKCIQEINQS